MKILIFLPSSNFAIDIISKALFLKENGYQVFFLSTSPRSKIHEYLEEKQIKCLSLNLNKLSSNNYLSAAFFLHKFVLKNKIDFIISNNLQGNFISVLSQFIHRKRTLLIRHHSDYIFHGKNKNAKRQQWFVNRFGKEFIAISDKVKDQMLVEGISPNKIHRINLGFDFTLFPKADQDHVEALKVELSNSLRLISIARLIPLKRHLLLFQSIKNLADKGLNVILWVVGEGPLKSELVDWVRSNQLEEVILFTGYIENTQDYLSASDLLINISESEASSHVVREASIYETPVLVCNEVGDFADYIVDDYNGYLIDKDSSAESLTNKIEEITGDKELVLKSDRLKKNVLARFDILINGKTLLKLILDNSQKEKSSL